MVMILDDWHWVDEASESALAHPLSALSQEPVLLVVAYRPQEFFPRWTPIMERTSIVLSSLSGPQTTELIHNHLGVKVLPVGLADKIQDRTSGNPLFIEEILRSLKESGALRIVEGEGRLTTSLDDLNLPSSVQSVIRSRLDRLDPESQEVMRVASVIGREFNVGPLTGAYTGSGDLETGLDRLCRHDVIQAVQGSEPTFVFNHVLTRMVVYEPLLIKRRRELHQRVAETLEVQHAESLENYYDDLAHHYQNSNHVEKAVHYLE
ncbi:MAG: hypothetical protein IIA14_09335, partial [SAR324 cluster bacterium]|nr:hypothetical protein [SAR324 cluster bacterium]